MSLIIKHPGPQHADGVGTQGSSRNRPAPTSGMRSRNSGDESADHHGQPQHAWVRGTGQTAGCITVTVILSTMIEKGPLASFASLHRDAAMLTVGTMRTTIDLPDDLHAQATAIARDTRQTLSQTVAQLMRLGLSSGRSPEFGFSRNTGLPVINVGRVITSEDVRRLEDDE